ncbi:MAG: metalloregulator ArsR/SmtB family transcription factor [Gammaproteobacteria bacterium]|nr:metalloregulator ArsR/SmtB family transcription factor [Gammaproteobacteria bacterium]MBU1724828.1 metalloregulator ArsR/SmtB family transcription factor [Gammaproteobacteria bacterium]MBU2006509.1 metalloregulator ArsR/SmtB family transcription factor [Gammaproteobacteria bacterium]
MQLETFAKALADQTRLRILLLLTGQEELCVCELTQALELAQPKISRHLAILRESGLLLDRKSGLWVYYRLHPELPQWAQDVLGNLQAGSFNETLFQSDSQRLKGAVRQNVVCCG